jgi:serine/threonine protein phosphatase PrpC
MEPVARALGVPVETVCGLVPRVQGIFMMTRSLGDASLKTRECCLYDYVVPGVSMIATPDIFLWKRQSNDVALVLMTDGVSEMLSEEEIVHLFESRKSGDDMNVAESIIFAAGTRACAHSRMTMMEMFALDSGPARRRVWDDSTCCVLSLDKYDSRDVECTSCA